MAKKVVTVPETGVDTKALEKQIVPIEKAALSLKVTSQPKYEQALSIRKDLRAMQAKVHDTFDPIVKSTKLAYDTSRKERDKFLKPLDEADSYLKRATTDYDDAQREKQAAKIEQAVESGNEEQVQRIVERAEDRRVEGVSYRDNWRAEVTDLLALVKAVAAGKITLDALMPNEVWLNVQARALKNSLAVPGVRAVNNRVQNIRG